MTVSGAGVAGAAGAAWGMMISGEELGIDFGEGAEGAGVGTTAGDAGLPLAVGGAVGDGSGTKGVGGGGAVLAGGAGKSFSALAAASGFVPFSVWVGRDFTCANGLEVAPACDLGDAFERGFSGS